jgi:hypothetical protein
VGSSRRSAATLDVSYTGPELAHCTTIENVTFAPTPSVAARHVTVPEG